MISKITRQVYNPFQDLWKRLSYLRGWGGCKGPLVPRLCKQTYRQGQGRNTRPDTQKQKNQKTKNITRKVTHTLSTNNDCTKYIKRAPVGANIYKKKYFYDKKLNFILISGGIYHAYTKKVFSCLISL